ncbi:hypothetical protein B7494_g5827 [Chlorociboria aeruginascens]|nr:hypothetical protein B7494_g5827 [Chlorociboria aeruginascens]
MPGTFSQMFPPTPSFTEKELGDLSGKVIVITGANSGVGYELAKMLYGKGGSVYIASRSPKKIEEAIASIQAQSPKSKGKLSPLKLDLADLSTIKQSAEELLAKEDRLHVIVHNAGVMTPPVGSKTSLGHDLEMGTNCLGPFLFNRFLEPTLKRTAASSEPRTVRIVWLTSLINIMTPQGGIIFDEKTGGPKVLSNPMENYMESKIGNVFFAAVTAERLASDGILSLSVNPGLMKTELQRNGPAAMRIIMKALFKGPQYGAYSELYAGFSPDIKSEDSGKLIVPWGRIGTIPEHITKALKPTSQGGTGGAQKFWECGGSETLNFDEGVDVNVYGLSAEDKMVGRRGVIDVNVLHGIRTVIVEKGLNYLLDNARVAVLSMCWEITDEI